MKKQNIPCAIIGCHETASDKHHIGGHSSPMIWVCKACHGRIHGIAWNSEHGTITRAGLAKARAEGRIGGNPRLRAGDKDEMARLRQRRADIHMRDLLDTQHQWLNIVNEMRPAHTWGHVAATVSRISGTNWTVERLRRTVKRFVDLGLVDATRMERAIVVGSKRPTQHLTTLIKALSETRSMAQVAAKLEAMGELTPRGGTRWHPSSVRHLLLKASGGKTIRASSKPATAGREASGPPLP